MPDLSGELVTTSGEVIGHHQGIHSFTVGQRKGLGVSSPNPLYVLAIHPDSHQVTVGPDEGLLTRDLTANRLQLDLNSRPRRRRRASRDRQDPPSPHARILQLWLEPATIW